MKVNLQVDAELVDTVGITNLVNELKRRGIKATIHYDYWPPFVNFLDESRGQADFVTTTQLVNYY